MDPTDANAFSPRLPPPFLLRLDLLLIPDLKKFYFCMVALIRSESNQPWCPESIRRRWRRGAVYGRKIRSLGVVCPFSSDLISRKMGCFPCFESQRGLALNPGRPKNDVRAEHPMVPPHIDRVSSCSSSFIFLFFISSISVLVGLLQGLETPTPIEW